MADKSTKELVKEIYKIVQQVKDTPLFGNSRMDVGPETQRGTVLSMLYDEGRLNSSEINAQLEADSASRALTALYRAYLVNRFDGENQFEYEISMWGKKEVESWADRPKQQRIVEESDSTPTNPWDQTKLNKGRYLALKAVVESDGHETSAELNKRYAKYGYETRADTPAISPRLTELLDRGYIGRTPKRPYLYWATDKGEELING